MWGLWIIVITLLSFFVLVLRSALHEAAQEANRLRLDYNRKVWECLAAEQEADNLRDLYDLVRAENERLSWLVVESDVIVLPVEWGDFAPYIVDGNPFSDN